MENVQIGKEGFGGSVIDMKIAEAVPKLRALNWKTKSEAELLEAAQSALNFFAPEVVEVYVKQMKQQIDQYTKDAEKFQAAGISTPFIFPTSGMDEEIQDNSPSKKKDKEEGEMEIQTKKDQDQVSKPKQIIAKDVSEIEGPVIKNDVKDFMKAPKIVHPTRVYTTARNQYA